MLRPPSFATRGRSCGGSTGLAMCIWHACPDRCGKFASGGKGTQKNGKGEEAMAKNLVVQVGKAGGEFELVEREIPTPGPGEVRIKVKACGICFSDHLVKDGAWPGLTYPRVPGHEVVGVIDEAGVGVTEWKNGDRVGVGWHGGHDFLCSSCRRGDFGSCAPCSTSPPPARPTPRAACALPPRYSVSQLHQDDRPARSDGTTDERT